MPKISKEYLNANLLSHFLLGNPYKMMCVHIKILILKSVYMSWKPGLSVLGEWKTVRDQFHFCLELGVL